MSKVKCESVVIYSELTKVTNGGREFLKCERDEKKYIICDNGVTKYQHYCAGKIK